MNTSPSSINYSTTSPENTATWFDYSHFTFQKFVLPIICLIGLTGNSMALILMRTNYSLKRLPSNYYLSALSAASSLFLATVLCLWADLTLQLPIYSRVNAGCKLLTFLAHVCDFLCVWLIVAVSFDRAVVLVKPRWRKSLCTIRVARRVIMGMVLVDVIVYSWCLVLANLVPNFDGHARQTECGVRDEHKSAYIGFNAFDTVVCTLIPSVLICLLNAIAIRRYRRCVRAQAQRQVQAHVRFRGSSATSEGIPTGTVITTLQATTTTASGPSTALRVRPMRPADLQLTRTLLIITSLFVLLNLPSYVLRLYYSFNWADPDTDEKPTVLFNMLNMVTYWLYYGHHAVLFYLYIFWSPQMKKELKPTALKLLECYCLKTVPDFGHEPVSSS